MGYFYFWNADRHPRKAAAINTTVIIECGATYYVMLLFVENHKIIPSSLNLTYLRGCLETSEFCRMEIDNLNEILKTAEGSLGIVSFFIRMRKLQ